MKIFGIQFGRSDEEETPVLKTEHYPVDETKGNEDEIEQRIQSVRVCSRCAAVYYIGNGGHACRY